MNTLSETVESPCIRECILNEDKICTGCHRYISEIVGWSHKSNYEQREIVDKAIKRKNEEIL
jgi:predicted Fe-S protein YdhL (DUF1289 family)